MPGMKLSTGTQLSGGTQCAVCYEDKGTLWGGSIEQGTEAHPGLREGLCEERTFYLKPGGHAYVVYTKGRRETTAGQSEPSMTP